MGDFRHPYFCIFQKDKHLAALEKHQKEAYTLQQQNTVILLSLAEKLGNDSAHTFSNPTSEPPPTSLISQQNVFLRASSDEQDVLQIEAGDFLDAGDSKMGIGSGGEDR